jgi:hypothetical protein
MNPIQHLAGQYLHWTQPPLFAMEYQLQDAERVQTLATLKWQTQLAMRATFTVGDHVWNIDRLGFLNVRIEIRDGETKKGDLVGTFKPSWNYHGTLTLADGRMFKWKNANIWGTEWKWTTMDDGDLMKFSPDSKLSRLTRSESRIELSPAVADFPEAPLLAALGWYMMLAMNMDAAAGS